MPIISDIISRQILDSRGNPTVEVDVVLSDGVIGRASVPSGASKGKYEALELRDNSDNYHGLAIEKALNNINTEISDILIGRSPFEQRSIDMDMIELDGTKNKRRLGANAMLGVSLSVCKASANSMKIPLWKYLGGINCNTLPVPMMNIINGGTHASNGLDFQEIMIMPVGFKTFTEALRAGVEIFHSLKILLRNNGYSTNVGDEGGFAPEIDNAEDAINLICKAIDKTNYKTGKDIFFAIDAAASEFYKNKKYFFQNSKISLDTDGLLKYWIDLIKKFPILSLEDPFHEDDIIGFINLQKIVGHKIQIVGDDLFVTSSKKLLDGVNMKAGNSILIKLNQVGTLTETIETINVAKKNNFNTIISHRSGETEDTFISDLAVGVNAGQIKTGSVSRSDRNCKYNQLIRIEEELGQDVNYFGKEFLTQFIEFKK